MRGASWHIRHGVSIGCGALTTKGGEELRAGQNCARSFPQPVCYSRDDTYRERKAANEFRQSQMCAGQQQGCTGIWCMPN